MAFYSNSLSGEQKPQKGEPREVTYRKLIMRKLITIALIAVYSFTSTNDFLLIKQRKCQLLSLLTSNTGIYFFPCLFVCLFFCWYLMSIYIVKNVCQNN